MSRFSEMWDKVLKEKLVSKTNIGNTGLSEKAKPDYADIDGDGDKEETMKKAAKDKELKEEPVDDEVIFTKHELFMAQAPSWNFELDEEQLLDKALELGFVTKIGDDQYLMNNDYTPLRARDDLSEAFILCNEDDNLKYEGKFKAGDTIKAYDFRPSKGRPDRYMVGVITGTAEREGAKMYVIKITNDSGKTDGGRVGDIGYVPMEVAHNDFNGRILLQSMYENKKDELDEDWKWYNPFSWFDDDDDYVYNDDAEETEQEPKSKSKSTFYKANVSDKTQNAICSDEDLKAMNPSACNEGEVGDYVKLSPQVQHDAYGFASVHHDGEFYLIFDDKVVGKYDKYEDFKAAHENAINKIELPEEKTVAESNDDLNNLLKIAGLK